MVTSANLSILLRGVLLTAFAGVLLSLVYHLSADTIKANQQAYEAEQLKEVVGRPDIELQRDGDEYALLDRGDAIGRLIQVTTPDGYNGNIRFWFAYTHSGKVLGVRIIQHQETPGLGDKLELAVSDWVLDFNGATLQSHRWDVKKYGGDFDQFSGATITPRAVVLAIKASLQARVAKTAPATGDKP